MSGVRHQGKRGRWFTFHLSVSKGDRERKGEGFKTWTLAWSNYVRCMLHFFPILLRNYVLLRHILHSLPAKIYLAQCMLSIKPHGYANNIHRRWDAINDMIFNTHLRGVPGPSCASSKWWVGGLRPSKAVHFTVLNAGTEDILLTTVRPSSRVK